MILQLTLLAIACALLLSKFAQRQNVFSPVRMFLYGWLLVLGTTASGVIQYERPFEWFTFFLVAATMAAFVFGTYAAARPRRWEIIEPKPFGQMRDDFDRLTLTALCLLSTIGFGLVLYDLLFFAGQFFLVGSIAELGQVRNDKWAEFFAGGSETSPVRSIGIVSCMAVATLLPYAIKYKRWLLQGFAAIASLVIVINSFLLAGRFALGVLILALLISTTLVYGGVVMRRLFTFRRVLVGLLAIFYFLIIFPTQRNPELAFFVERHLQWSSDASIAEWVKTISKMPNMTWVEILAYSTGYFSGSLDKLNYFVTQTDVLSWYKLGLYNITQISQVFGSLNNGITPWHEIRMDIAELMRHAGWSLNPWATGIRDLGIDFGPFGAVLLAGILGYLGQTAYDKSLAKRSYVSLITATYVSIACFIFAFISPFQIRILSNGLWLLAILAFARFLVAQAVGQKPATISQYTPCRVSRESDPTKQ